MEVIWSEGWVWALMMLNKSYSSLMGSKVIRSDYRKFLIRNWKVSRIFLFHNFCTISNVSKSFMFMKNLSQNFCCNKRHLRWKPFKILKNLHWKIPISFIVNFSPNEPQQILWITFNSTIFPPICDHMFNTHFSIRLPSLSSISIYST